ncbi:MAG: OsmC family protein [Candidatus Omnitrophota bacterium]|nr:OsmC family protein [Candidatus Omnitrophota bacterium]
MAKTKRFIYENFIKWQGEKKGLLSSPDKLNIEVAAPPEFKGHYGKWSPEDLFVAAVNSCIMTTFLYYAQRNNLNVLNYKSKACGMLEMQEGKLVFTQIGVEPEIIIVSSEDRKIAKEFIDKAENNCLISSSIKAKVKIIPEIKIGNGI